MIMTNIKFDGKIPIDLHLSENLWNSVCMLIIVALHQWTMDTAEESQCFCDIFLIGVCVFSHSHLNFAFSRMKVIRILFYLLNLN